jgi:hypothetical protein
VQIKCFGRAESVEIDSSRVSMKQGGNPLYFSKDWIVLGDSQKISVSPMDVL